MAFLEVIIGLAIPIIILGFVVALILIRKYAPQLWFVLKVTLFRRKAIASAIVKTELENSKKHNYESFQDFLQDCPKYQIDNSYLGNVIRKIYHSFGANYEQFVWVSPNKSDKTAWLRVKGEIVLHDGGTYALPTKSEKKIKYYFDNDMRPIFDMLDDPDWRNPDAVAEVVTAISNSNNMKAMRNNASGQDNLKYTLIILIASVLINILFLAFMYQYDTANGQTVEMLKLIVNQTVQP